MPAPYRLAGRDAWIVNRGDSEEPDECFISNEDCGARGNHTTAMYFCIYGEGWKLILPGIVPASSIWANADLAIRNIMNNGGSCQVVQDDNDLSRQIGGTLAFILSQAPPTDPVEAAEYAERIRGMILQKTGKWVPVEVVDIKAWLIENLPPPKTLPTPASPRGREYTVEGSYGRNVSGNCRYTATEHYAGSVDISEARMIEIFNDCDGDEDEMQDALNEYVWDNEGFDSDGEENRDYDDHEQTDSDGRENEENNSRVVVRDFLDDHPELVNDEEAPAEEAPEEAAPQPSPEILPNGTTVRVQWLDDPYDGLTGVVRGMCGDSYCIEFAERARGGNGHDCSGLFDHNRGWEVGRDNLVVVELPLSLNCL